MSNVVWPNEVDPVPDEMFGPNHIIACGGFLIPFAQTGQVTLYNTATGERNQISTNERNYFYHQAKFRDVDGDGLLDIITAKVNFPTSTIGKLVWFRNPGTRTFPWEERTLITGGPDIFFELHDFNGDGLEEIVAPCFFAQKLSIYYNFGNFSNPNDWKERLIDNKVGGLFDVEVVDLNKDGRVDILATNHQGKINESAVMAYEVPNDFVNGAYTRHIIAMGFDTTQPGDNQASPGGAVTFYPVTSNVNEKPYILVSGDGTQRAHLIKPLSQSPSNWDYDMNTLIYVANTVGGVSVGDVDGDGYTEMFIPSFESGDVHVFTFSPSKNN